MEPLLPQVTRPRLLLVLLVLLVPEASAQSGPPQRSLPQWLTGIIAVSGFLFLVFVTLLVNRVWCSSRRGRSRPVGGAIWPSSHLDSVRSDELKAYQNQALDQDEEKVTAM